MNFDESLSLSQVHHPTFEGRVALAQHFKQGWNRIGSSHLDRSLRISLSFQRPVIICQPAAQRLSLIHRLLLAQRLPRNPADDRDEQNGERDLDPLSHGGIMSRLQRKSRTCG